MSAAQGNTFTMRTALLLVLGGAALFVALLWMIGAGMSGGTTNDGGGHGAGKGLNGYAGLVQLIEASGHEVRHARSEDALETPGLLVLTPPHHADAGQVNRVLAQRRYAGPTLLILPKWQAMPLPAEGRPPGAKEGWVMLGGAQVADWTRNLAPTGDLDARLGPGSGRWNGVDNAGALPDASAVQTISAGSIAALVTDGSGQALAALLDDGNDHGALSRAVRDAAPQGVGGSDQHPLVIVAEPDLLDNYGLAREENARLALALIATIDNGQGLPVTFDLTLNGLGRASNLLTLAFTLPFLAATLCLLLAALVIGWRAFLRFGAPRRGGRSIALGKRALVANSAGFVRRTGRMHLVTAPYADRARVTLVRAMGLARQSGPDDADRAIDRALAARDPDAVPFSRIIARLRGATNTTQAVTAARELHALERKLKR